MMKQMLLKRMTNNVKANVVRSLRGVKMDQLKRMKDSI